MKPRVPYNPVSADDAEKFKGYISKWQGILNLQDWRLVYSEKPTKAMSDIVVDIPSRMATYRIGNFGSTPITDFALEQTAIHELLHILTSMYEDAVRNMKGADSRMSAEHSLIHTLERLLVPS